MAETVLDKAVDWYRSDHNLRSMPGVGRYISNSVRCCSFGIDAPALDANMIRVLDRVFGWKSSLKRAREDKLFWEFANSLVPVEKCREFNWGILDFASSICTFKKPKCESCPIRTICSFYDKSNSSK